MGKNVIDVAAMGKAGFQSLSEGRNPANEQRELNRKNAAKYLGQAANFVGGLAIDQLFKAKNALNHYDKLGSTQVGEINFEMGRFQDLDPQNLVTLEAVNADYEAAIKKASWGWGSKKRKEGRVEAAEYMAELQSIAKFWKSIEANTPESRKRTKILAGGRVGDDGVDTPLPNPANYTSELTNLTEQGSGLMNSLYYWDRDKKMMMVKRGGMFQNAVDELGNPTGEKEYVDSQIPQLVDGKWQYVTQKVYGEPYHLMSTGQDADNRLEGILDDEIGTVISGAKDEIYNARFQAGLEKDDIMDRIRGHLSSEEMDNNAYTTWYFGGFSHDHTTGKLATSAPAYIRLLGEDMADPEKWDAETKMWKTDGGGNPLYGPGTADWEGRKALLKRMNFDRGGELRREGEGIIYNRIVEKYNKERKVIEDYNTATAAAKGDKIVSKAVVDLPWQKGLATPTNIAARAQHDLVQDVLSGQGEVRRGNDIYKLQENGKYKLTHEEKGGKRYPVEKGEVRTRTSLIQVEGGAYGNIPDDYFELKLVDHDNLAPTPKIKTSQYEMDLKKGTTGTHG